MSEPFTVAKLSLRPGDVLVVHAPDVKSPEVGGQLVKMFKDIVTAGVEVIVTQQPLDFSILGKPVPADVDEPTTVTVGER